MLSGIIVSLIGFKYGLDGVLKTVTIFANARQVVVVRYG